MPPLGLGFKGQQPPKSQIASPLDDYESVRSYQSDESYTDDSHLLDQPNQARYNFVRERSGNERDYRDISNFNQPSGYDNQQSLNFHGQPRQERSQYFDQISIDSRRIRPDSRYSVHQPNNYGYLPNSNRNPDRFYDQHQQQQQQQQPDETLNPFVNRIYPNQQSSYAYQPLSNTYETDPNYYVQQRPDLYETQIDDQPHPQHRAVGHPSSYQEISEEEEEAYRRNWEQSLKQRMEKDRYQLPPLEPLEHPKPSTPKPTNKPLHLSGSVEYDRIIQQFHTDAGNYGGVEGFFDEIDFNRDGVINLEEFRNYLRFHEVIVDR